MNSYDLTEDKRNSLIDYQNAVQNGLGVSQYDHATMIDTLIGLRNIASVGDSYEAKVFVEIIESFISDLK